MIRSNARALVLIVLATLVVVPLAFAANSFTQSYSVPNRSAPQHAQLSVSLLRYEPYPVNPGQWADVYVTISNIGEASAHNVTVAADPSYPFDRIQLISGASPIVYGSVDSSHYDTSAGVISPDTTQTVVHFKVHIEPGAANDTYPLRVKTTSSGNVSMIFTVPISVQQVRTSFDLSTARSSSDRTLISVQNTGTRPASAVTVTLRGDAAALSAGPTSVLVGDLASGDVTEVGFPLDASALNGSVPLSVSYTDIAGNRVEVNRTVSVSSPQPVASSSASSSVSSLFDSKWVFALLGLFVGLFIMILARAARR